MVVLKFRTVQNLDAFGVHYIGKLLKIHTSPSSNEHRSGKLVAVVGGRSSFFRGAFLSDECRQSTGSMPLCSRFNWDMGTGIDYAHGTAGRRKVTFVSYDIVRVQWIFLKHYYQRFYQFLSAT